MTLLAGYLALVHRLTEQSDVVIGIPVANREGRAESRLVGFCTRPLPIRTRQDSHPRFAEFVAPVHSLLRKPSRPGLYPILAPVKNLPRPRDGSRFPLFS